MSNASKPLYCKQSDLSLNIMVASNNDIPDMSMLEDNEPDEIGKILIVDDEQFNHDVLFSFLKILEVKNRKEISEFVYDGQ